MQTTLKNVHGYVHNRNVAKGKVAILKHKCIKWNVVYIVLV